MSEAIRQVKEYTHFTARERAHILQLTNERWIQLYTP